MAGTDGDLERTLTIGQRALELIKAYGSTAAPRAYEVWFTYVTGQKPMMNDAIKRITADRGTVSEVEIETIHEQHLSGQRFSTEAERCSAGVIAEIDQAVEMIELALGSTAKYGESLAQLSHEAAGPVDRARVREILQSLVIATRDVSSNNRTLEARLRETRGEIESLRETLEAVRVEALTDPLTGIANRKHFEEMLVKAIDHASVERSPMALVVLDIDHFKRFNDNFGHLTGDQVLRLVGMTMREQVKSKATLARFGGEEFGIILPDTTAETARGVSEAIRLSVMSRELVKRSTGESLGKVTVSMGIAAFRRGDTAVSLLERADQCMFAAKRAGRNRIVGDGDVDESGELPDVA